MEKTWKTMGKTMIMWKKHGKTMENHHERRCSKLETMIHIDKHQCLHGSRGGLSWIYLNLVFLKSLAVPTGTSMLAFLGSSCGTVL